MKSSLFEYKCYKRYLRDRIAASPNGERGQRKKLAEGIQCQVSYVSSVLNGESHFSPEQTEASARYFGLNESETEFLLLLVQLNRAGTASLRRVYEKSLQKIVRQKSKLKNRLEIDSSISKAHELEHYSSWHYGAVHVLLSIPEYRDRESIARKLRLPLTRVDQILQLLVDSKMAHKKGATYSIGKSQIHLERDSYLTSKHHSNWRLRTLQEFDGLDSESLHYSAAVTLSREDFAVVREILANSLARGLKVIKKSEEQEAAVLCLDFYRL